MASSYMSPNRGGGGAGCGVSANKYSCAHGAQINFEDLPPYLIHITVEGIAATVHIHLVLRSASQSELEFLKNLWGLGTE
jgi:hypothetical protein